MHREKYQQITPPPYDGRQCSLLNWVDDFENAFAELEDLGLSFSDTQKFDQFLMHVRNPDEDTHTLVSHCQETFQGTANFFPAACNYVRSEAIRNAAFDAAASKIKAHQTRTGVSSPPNNSISADSLLPLS